MKFHCKHCGKTIIRDMRYKPYKGKKVIKSYCEKAGRNVFLKRGPEVIDRPPVQF